MYPVDNIFNFLQGHPLVNQAKSLWLESVTFDYRYMYYVFANTGLAEGNGTDYCVLVAETHREAVYASKGIYVMGSDGPIKEIMSLVVTVQIPAGARDVFAVPVESIKRVNPNSEERAREAALAKLSEADKKVLGLT